MSVKKDEEEPPAKYKIVFGTGYVRVAIGWDSPIRAYINLEKGINKAAAEGWELHSVQFPQATMAYAVMVKPEP
jgi:hypothetical protein